MMKPAGYTGNFIRPGTSRRRCANDAWRQLPQPAGMEVPGLAARLQWRVRSDSPRNAYTIPQIAALHKGAVDAGVQPSMGTLPGRFPDGPPAYRPRPVTPTQLNCGGDVDGKIVGTVERLGVPIAYIKDRRALVRPVAAAR
jgi:hypothetical protein